MSKLNLATLHRLCIVLLCACTSLPYANAAEPVSNSPTPQSRYPQLLAKANQLGKVRVIVALRLNQAWKPDGDLQPADLDKQQKAIIAAQQQLLAKFSAKANSPTTKLFGVPALAMEVSAAELNLLIGDPLVESVVEDGEGRGGLIQSVPLVDAPAAWTAGYTGSGQAIAVLDIGVETSHPFLSGAVVTEACFSTNSAPYQTLCPNGLTSQTGSGAAVPCTDVAGESTSCSHGTHVAGAAAGRNGSVSGTAINGVAKGASLIAIQVFSKKLTGGVVTDYVFFDSDLISSLDYVYTLRTVYSIAAVNLSLYDFGGTYTGNCDSYNTSLAQQIARLRSVKIAPVIISGNDGSSTGITSPGCMTGAVVVGATTKSDTLWEITGQGSNSNSLVTLLAPGENILSSVKGGGYSSFTGTSMAAPHVAGAFAILKARRPNGTVSQLAKSLTVTGSGITDARNGIKRPRIDIAKALKDDPYSALIPLLMDD